MASVAVTRAANRKASTKPPVTVPGPAQLIGQDEFRAFLLKPGSTPIDVSTGVTGLSWSDSGPILTGDLQLQDPDPSVRTVAVSLGDTVQLQGRARAVGTWVELWRMRVMSASVALTAGQRGWSLADDLQNAVDSEMDWRFVKDKAHKSGWTAAQIIRAVCSKSGISIGALPSTSYRIKRYTNTKTSPLDVITDVLKTERVHTGRRFVMRFRRGKLYITPLVRSELMYEMGPTIIEGTYSIAKREDYATMLTVRGTVAASKSKDSKGHAVRKARKINVRVSRPSTTARFGVVHKIVTMKGLDSLAEARARGLAEIAKRMRPTQTLTFSHPGIMGIRRGQSMRMRDAKHGLVQVVWVTEVRHTVGPGDYTIEVTVTFSDPFALTSADKSAIKRAAAAAAKGRKTAASNKKAVKPKPAKAKQRA